MEEMIETEDVVQIKVTYQRCKWPKYVKWSLRTSLMV